MVGARVVSFTPTAAHPSAWGRSFRSLSIHWRERRVLQTLLAKAPRPVDQQGFAHTGIAHNRYVDAILNLLLAKATKGYKL